MRIALIYLGRRGAGIPISLEFTRWLSQSDQVLVVLSNTTAAAPAWHELPVEVLSTTTYQNTIQAGWSWIEGTRIAKLAQQISAWKPDVLLFPMFYTWNPFLQSRLRQYPSVIAVHDPRPHPGIADRIFQILEDWSIHQSKRCLVFSQSLAPVLTRRGMSLSQIDVISLGTFGYARYQDTPTHKAEPCKNKPTMLLFFGRITTYKGLDILLKAYKQVVDRYPVRLVIAGEGDLQPYQELIKTTPDVEVINRWIIEEEIPGIFQQADIVILPYTSASQSGVIPIAAGFGLPVIATRTGGIPEQIENEENGLLVDPGTVDQLVDAIARLINDPDLASELGQKLKADFEMKHSWQKITAVVKASLEDAFNLRYD